VHWSGSVDSWRWGPHGSPPAKFQAAGVLCMLQLPLAGRCPATSKHVGGMQGDFSKLASWNLGFHDSCNWSKEKRRQNIHTPNSHVPAPRLPPAVGSGLLSSFRACLLACWRAGLLVARVLRPFLLACLLRACSPARLFFAPLAFGFKMVYIYMYIYTFDCTHGGLSHRLAVTTMKRPHISGG
jgi:hypothetical protein